MEIIKHVDWELLKIKKVLKTILKDIDNDDDVVYNIWKHNKIIAKIVSYRKHHVR